jgi:hypothetical protein
MHEHLMGPFWGNVVIIVIAGAITAACFGGMLWMLFRPGEKDRNHPKYGIFQDKCDP